MHTRRLRRSTTMGLVATLAVSLAVATASTASAADGPSVQLPNVSPVAVNPVGQGSRGNEKDEAAQSARTGNQTGLPTSLPGEGTYTATTLSQSGKWDVAGQTGDFTWAYPLKVPPAAGGLEPSLGLGYSSSAVDGLTSASNNQASWVGDGWALWPGFIERTYGGCQTDLGGDPKNNPGDLCWKSDNATLSLNGSQTTLIRDDVSGVWKPKHDNGSRIDRWTGVGNGDDNGEHWRVTTTDGTQYFFGIRTDSGATWTVPVYGDDTNEPCNRLNDFAGSWCDQAYRWQVDKVVSVNGDVMIYNYGTESNKYGQNKNTRAASYVRGGWLKNIEYGLRDDTPGLAASGRVVFEDAERCVPGATNCDWNNPQHRNNFPDIPLELKCDGTTCKDTWSPSFWTTKRLNKIRTEVRDGEGYRPVDSWTLRHEFPYPNDDNKPALWLAGVTHTGHDGGNLPLPEVTFEGVRKPNRVVKPNDGASFLIRFRIGAIVSESGAVTSVNYADRNCDENTVITPETNTLRCFPAKWSIPGVAEPRTDYFHKYVVASVSSSDWIGSELSSETMYDYVGGAAWHFDESEFTREEDKTWNQFRGYGQVIVRTGRRSDDPKTRTKASTTYYRGMNGDKGKPPAKVTDSEGGSEDDHNWLNGNVRETITYLGDTGDVVNKTISEPYWRDKPTAKRGVFEARIVRPKIARSFTMLDGGGKQETKTESFYDNDLDPTAMVTRVHDFGDVTKTDDDRCATTTYARNAEKWLMNLVSEVDTVAVGCGATATFPKDALSNNRTTYDDRGNVTSTQVLKARPAADRLEHITTSRVDPKDIDKHGRALKIANALGKVSTSEYTPSVGGPVTKTKSANPLGFGVTSTLNPARGTAVHAIDVNERVTESAYDPLGRLTQVWLPGREPSPERDNGNKKFHYKVSRTEPNVVTTEVLGPRGNYLTSKDILDGQLRPRQTQRPTDEGRLLTETRYDVHGRAFLQTAPFFTTGEVDDKLWKASNSEAIPTHTVTEFDGAGRSVAEVFKAPTEKWRSTTTYGGNWVKVTPPPGGVPTTTLFDARGQVVERRTDAPGATHDTTSYRYTAAGQVSEVKDPENNSWRNEYDLLGRQIVQHDPDKGVTRKTYNDVNQVVESTDALGAVLRTTYDDMGRPRLNEQVFPDRPAEKRAEWTYDTVGDYGKGLPASVTRWVGTTPYTSSIRSYDRAGRAASTQLVIPNSEPGVGGTYLTTMRYNPDGSLQSTGLPAIGVKDTPGALGAETVLHEYDDFGRITSTTGGPADKGPFNYVTDTIYTKYGEPQQLWLGDEGQHTWVSMYYEADTRRPSRTIVDTQTAKPMQADINYTYNPAGSVTSVADQPLDKTPDIQCFSYDHLERLTSAWTPAKAPQPCAAAPSSNNLAGPAQYWQSFTYDKVGNRITDTQHSAQGDTVRTYGKGDAHKLKSVSTTKPGLAAAAVDTPTYDATGNTATRKSPAGVTQQLDWDVEGRLAKVREGNKVVAEFVYGATGERLIRREPAAGSTTVYLPGQELQVRGTVKTATRHYAHGGFTVASRSGDRLDYVATDHQGTVNTSIEVSSLKAERRRQLPFGGPRGPQGDFVGDKGFVGGTVDAAAGFTTLGARQYDPDTGRFLSVDPIGDFADAQQMHGYTYSNNSPITKSDPSGMIWGRSPGCAQEGPCEYEHAWPDSGSSSPDTAQPSPPPSSNNSSSSSGRLQLPKPGRARVPDGVSREHQVAWMRRYQAMVRQGADCSLPLRPTLQEHSWCSDARAELSQANKDYDNLLAKEERDRARTPRPGFEDLLNAVVKRENELLREGKLRPNGEKGLTVSACGGVEAYVGGGVAGEICVAKDHLGWGYSLTGKVGVAPKAEVGVGVSVKVTEGAIEDLKGRGRWVQAGPVEIGQSADGKVSISGGAGISRGVSALDVAAGTEWTASARFTPDFHKYACTGFGACPMPK